jgi:error-prone DNA polymerase
VVAADYTPGEADQLRRDMAAWRRSGRIEKHHERFVERMTAKGITEEFAEAVFQQIRGFGEYGFPESHAASFALIAYCTAWMRAHYPAEFICGLLNAWPMGFYSPASIVEDAKRHGVEMRSIDVLRSEWDCTLEAVQNAPRRSAEASVRRADASSAPWESRFRDQGDSAVRMGLRYVKGISEEEYRRIVRARGSMDRPGERSAVSGGRGKRRGGNEALERFIQSSRLSEDMLVALARAGGFGSFGLDRRQALWEVSGRKRRRESEERERTRVGDAADLLSGEDALPVFDQLNDFELVAWDYYTSSHSTQAHPLEPHRDALSEAGHPSAREIWQQEDGARASYVGLVITRQRPGTAGGTMFITLEDETGYVNLVVWKAVFERFRTVILTASLLGVEGRVQAKDGVVHLIVDRCFRPQLSLTGFKVESRNFR